jgi:hypothetical protein
MGNGIAIRWLPQSRFAIFHFPFAMKVWPSFSKHFCDRPDPNPFRLDPELQAANHHKAGSRFRRAAVPRQAGVWEELEHPRAERLDVRLVAAVEPAHDFLRMRKKDTIHTFQRISREFHASRP